MKLLPTALILAPLLVLTTVVVGAGEGRASAAERRTLEGQVIRGWTEGDGVLVDAFGRPYRIEDAAAGFFPRARGRIVRIDGLLRGIGCGAPGIRHIAVRGVRLGRSAPGRGALRLRGLPNRSRARGIRRFTATVRSRGSVVVRIDGRPVMRRNATAGRVRLAWNSRRFTDGAHLVEAALYRGGRRVGVDRRWIFADNLRGNDVVRRGSRVRVARPYRGLVGDRPAGVRLTSAWRSWWRYRTVDVRSGASVTTRRDVGGNGSAYLRFDLPAGVERAELRQADWNSTAGQRNLAHAQAIGEISYIAFAFRYPRAPRNAGWGHLVMQMKSLNTNRVPRTPPVSLADQGKGLELLTNGGAGENSCGVPLPGIRTGRWYKAVLGVRLETGTRGFARLWLAPAGAPLPPLGRPTIAIENTPTNYFGARSGLAGLWSIGPYQDRGAGGSVVFDTSGFARAPTYAGARRLLEGAPIR